jgi:hypothetical protein
MAKKATNGENPGDTAPATAESGSSGEAKSATPRKPRGMKKTAMFDRAMETLGADAKPLRIQEWIKENYRVTLKPTLLSTYKGNWVKKHGRGGQSAKAASAVNKTGGKDATLSDIKQLQALIARIGVPQLKEILTLLGVS